MPSVSMLSPDDLTAALDGKPARKKPKPASQPLSMIVADQMMDDDAAQRQMLIDEMAERRAKKAQQEAAVAPAQPVAPIGPVALPGGGTPPEGQNAPKIMSPQEWARTKFPKMAKAMKVFGGMIPVQIDEGLRKGYEDYLTSMGVQHNMTQDIAHGKRADRELDLRGRVVDQGDTRLKQDQLADILRAAQAEKGLGLEERRAAVAEKGLSFEEQRAQQAAERLRLDQDKFKLEQAGGPPKSELETMIDSITLAMLQEQQAGIPGPGTAAYNALKNYGKGGAGELGMSTPAFEDFTGVRPPDILKGETGGLIQRGERTEGRVAGMVANLLDYERKYPFMNAQQRKASSDWIKQSLPSYEEAAAALQAGEIDREGFDLLMTLVDPDGTKRASLPPPEPERQRTGYSWPWKHAFPSLAPKEPDYR